jgi:hypothetical protein
MKRYTFLIPFLILALVTLACGVHIDLPVTQVKTGPTVTEQISAPAPSSPSAVSNLTLSFGAGKIKLNPGAENALVSGTATYNVPDFKPVMKVDGNDVTIEQGNLELKGIPKFGENIKNEWDLKLGATPINLKVNGGAYQADYELGGLAIQQLEIVDGAADVHLAFSQANTAEMSLLQYSTGASKVTITGLANANAADMQFTSGAGNYELDFSGELKRDVNVAIESGLSTVKIIVPKGVSATVETEGGLSTVNYRDDWQKSGTSYTVSGSGPAIKITVKMAAGTLDLSNK